MRIVAGELKGRVLRVPKRDLRPTSERVREALFSMLGEHVRGARVLDGYAGSGALGFEALSRGAEQVVFVERDPVSARQLSENARDLGVEQRVTAVRGEWVRWARAAKGSFDLVFLDPPYGLPELPEAVRLAGARVAPAGLLVVEVGERDTLPSGAGELPLTAERRYGGTRLGIYGVRRDDDPSDVLPSA